MRKVERAIKSLHSDERKLSSFLTSVVTSKLKIGEKTSGTVEKAQQKNQ